MDEAGEVDSKSELIEKKREYIRARVLKARKQQKEEEEAIKFLEDDGESALDELYGVADLSIFESSGAGAGSEGAQVASSNNSNNTSSKRNKKKKGKKKERKKREEGESGEKTGAQADPDWAVERLSTEEFARRTNAPPAVIRLMHLKEQAKKHLKMCCEYLEDDLDRAQQELREGEAKYETVRKSPLLKGKGRAIAEVASMDRLFKMCKEAIVNCRFEAAKKHHNRGAQMAQDGDLDRAIACYKLALCTHPKFFESLYSMGLTHKKKGDKTSDAEEKRWCYEEAVGSYRQALLADPNWSCSGRVYSDLGIALECLGDLDGAVTAYKSGLEAEPGDSRTHNNYATALLALGKTDEAIGQLQEAMRVAPADANAYFNLGVVYKDKKELAKSVQLFKRAVQLNPRWANAYYGLGGAQWEWRQAEEAVVNWEKAVELDPGHQGAKEALRMEQVVSLKKLGLGTGKHKCSHDPVAETWVLEPIEKAGDEGAKFLTKKGGGEQDPVFESAMAAAAAAAASNTADTQERYTYATGEAVERRRRGTADRREENK
jgi:tetratricopeptide (TPR) repeat protein